ncbi:hypothetical protein O3P69_018767, partial [Scylla paramamosain]
PPPPVRSPSTRRTTVAPLPSTRGQEAPEMTHLMHRARSLTSVMMVEDPAARTVTSWAAGRPAERRRAVPPQPHTAGAVTQTIPWAASLDRMDGPPLPRPSAHCPPRPRPTLLPSTPPSTHPAACTTSWQGSEASRELARVKLVL